MRSTGYPLHRPELYDRLCRGEDLILRAMSANEAVHEPGQQIVRSGELDDRVYWLRAGWACRSGILDDGRRQIVTLFLPGDFLGLKSLLHCQQLECVESITSATVNWLEHDRLRRLADEDRDVALRLLFELADEDRRLLQWVIALGRGHGEERLAAFFLELRARVRRLNLAQGPSFTLPMTQQQIADHLGLTEVHVNRILRRLRESGIMTFRDRTAVIQNEAALRHLAVPILTVFEQGAGLREASI